MILQQTQPYGSERCTDTGKGKGKGKGKAILVHRLVQEYKITMAAKN